MVSETHEQQEVDQVPAEQQETEVPAPEVEEVPTEESPTEEVGDAAPAEEAATADEEPRYTAEQVQQYVKWQAEQDHARRQGEQARKAAADQREREEREEVMDTFGVELSKLGVDVDDPAKLTKPFERYVTKRTAQIEDRTVSATDRAFEYIAAPILGTVAPELTETEAKLAARLAPHFQKLLAAIDPVYHQQISEGYVPKSEIPKLEKAAIEAYNARQRQGKTDIKRIEGAPADGVMSWAAYSALSDAQKLAMPVEERRKIMAADAQRRAGG